jgi:transposase
LDPTFEPKEIRQMEVITGVGGRCAWSNEDKARIVGESSGADAIVSALARRYGCGRSRSMPGGGRHATAPWRCRRKGRWGLCRSWPRRAHWRRRCPRRVEIEIAGAVIRAAPGVDWRHLHEVLRAVKAVR